MKRLLEWWRGRKWEYLGYSKLTYNEGPKKGEDAGVVHFYAWINNQKHRMIKATENEHIMKSSIWYNTAIVPWLEGGDMWKPIQHPVAVRGSIINYVGNQPK